MERNRVGNRIVAVNEKESELLLRELVTRILLENASEAELIELIKTRSVLVFGRQFNNEDAREALEPVQQIARTLRSSQGNLDQRPQEPERERSLLKSLSFIIGGVTLKLRLQVISTCPGISGILLGSYESLQDGNRYSLRALLDAIGGIDGLASDLVHRIEYIRAQREMDPGFLMDDENMEYLRQVLFLINRLKVSDELFCDFGQGILRDLRAYVRDYEKKHATKRRG